MASENRRIEIGFDGGQVLAVRVPTKALNGLREALGRDGWHHLETDEAEIDVSLSKVVFLKTVADEQRVGFGSP